MIKHFLIRCVRELQVHNRRLTWAPRKLRKAIAFLSDGWSGTSGDLRAKSLEPELLKFGWRMICVPHKLDLVQRRRILALDKPEVILLQQSRHPLNRPRYYPGIPCIFDVDDADLLDPNCTEAVIECCRDSISIVAASRTLAEMFRPYNSNAAVVWTTSYLRPSEGAKPTDEREPMITWASASPMGFPEEGKLVREVILRLAGQTKFSFSLYGVGEDQRIAADQYLEPIRTAGVPVQVFAPMPYEQFVRSLESVAVGLQPICLSNPFSRGRSFGKLLAYLAAGVAIVATNAVDHPLFFRDGVNGMLVDDEVDTWVKRCEQLLTQPTLRRKIVDAARSDYLSRLTTERAAKLVAEQFVRAVELSKSRVVGGRSSTRNGY